MATLLLIAIYLAFISLGLPDSLLGSAWPVMQPEFGQSLDTAGYIFMAIASGTIVSSLASGWLYRRLGTGNVTFASVILTAAALLGYSYSSSLVWLILFALPLGLGAGAIDSVLNNYVALHYKAHHMSWLHCFWGVGASTGPIIMSHYITGQGSWRAGYFTISILQFSLAFVLLLVLPLWSRVSNISESKAVASNHMEPAVPENGGSRPLSLKGVKFALVSFFFYCGAESTVGLWGSSFLVQSKGISAAGAAQWISLYYAGITIGRLITGFITLKVSSKMLIRTGQIIALMGAVILILPLPAFMLLPGLILAGLGLAPIFPCMIHETPIRFGKHHSQSFIGFQMAAAYTGTTFLPPLLGILASRTSIGIFPFLAAVYMIAMLFTSEKINKIMKIRLEQNIAG
ncbi:MFS transporter [Bacillus sp. MUM 13]|uniref:MFS transporter n=1 Tax=Bacillus sp. MUM 13 TaxID=1678001 RepID=UPI0008F5A5C0|nr:MFS transporter [Bacillus sp. MUM 13]OIK08651.1 MFS transporter [Bacillus sp. MUM 13]